MHERTAASERPCDSPKVSARITEIAGGREVRDKPEWTEHWLELTRPFTEATPNEPVNLFDWSRRVDDPDEFVLDETFQVDAAGGHVNSEHFKKAMQTIHQALIETPRIVTQTVDQDGWNEMGELTID